MLSATKLTSYARRGPPRPQGEDVRLAGNGVKLYSPTMTAPVALLTVSGSSLAHSLGSRIEGRGATCHLLDVDAPLEKKPVSITSRAVLWQGVDLLSSGAVLLEWPVYPWPQPLATSLPAVEVERKAAVTFEREARSLIVSAIRIAAEHVPIVNPPQVSQLAATPSIALDVARQAGIPVAPWRLGPFEAAGGDTVILDSVGRDRWHTPTRPRKNDPALMLEAASGEVASVLVVGGRASAVAGYENPGAWLAGEAIAGSPDWAREPAFVEPALRAAESCGISLAEIAVVSKPIPQILFIDAAPKLASWGLRTEGLVFDALADYMVALARGTQKATSSTLSTPTSKGGIP